MKTKFSLVVLFAILVVAVTGYRYRAAIITLLKGKTTVEAVMKNLKETRGAEFLESYTDLYEIADVLLVAIKNQKKLQVYTRTSARKKYILRKEYPFTAYSGTLGHKYKEGDRQIPEGVYRIEGLNPNSLYHLSMKVGYPNDLDKQMAALEGRTNLGSDIFIHGKNYTVGCIPLGDKNIEELFYLVATVKPANTKIIIMPVDLRLPQNNDHQGKNETEQTVYRTIRKEIMPGTNYF